MAITNRVFGNDGADDWQELSFTAGKEEFVVRVNDLEAGGGDLLKVISEICTEHDCWDEAFQALRDLPADQSTSINQYYDPITFDTWPPVLPKQESEELMIPPDKVHLFVEKTFESGKCYLVINCPTSEADGIEPALDSLLERDDLFPSGVEPDEVVRAFKGKLSLEIDSFGLVTYGDMAPRKSELKVYCYPKDGEVLILIWGVEDKLNVLETLNQTVSFGCTSLTTYDLAMISQAIKSI